MTAIGQAAEMLMKATLAGVNPVLIAEKNSSTHTLWALAGITRQLPEGKVATVGGTEALRRLNECKPPAPRACQSPSRCSKFGTAPSTWRCLRPTRTLTLP
jgi:hypothetical protein